MSGRPRAFGLSHLIRPIGRRPPWGLSRPGPKRPRSALPSCFFSYENGVGGACRAIPPGEACAWTTLSEDAQEQVGSEVPGGVKGVGSEPVGESTGMRKTLHPEGGPECRGIREVSTRERLPCNLAFDLAHLAASGLYLSASAQLVHRLCGRGTRGQDSATPQVRRPFGPPTPPTAMVSLKSVPPKRNRPRWRGPSLRRISTGRPVHTA